MKIGLKKMRSSLICLTIIERKKYLIDPQLTSSMVDLKELIVVFAKSIATASKNLKTEKN